MCPVGKYLDVTGAKTEEECIACSGGKACTIPGLTAPDFGEDLILLLRECGSHASFVSPLSFFWLFDLLFALSL